MINFTEPVIRGILRIVMQVGGWFLGALAAHVQLGYARYPDVAVIPNVAYSTGEAFMIEYMGELMGLLLVATFMHTNVQRPQAALFLGAYTWGIQAISHPISGASMNILHWLSANTVGSLENSTFYWPGDCWIYAISSLTALLTAVVLLSLRKWAVHYVREPGAYEKIE